MPLFGELFVSEILGKTVIDPAGEDIGVLKDIVIVKGDPLPKVDALILERKKNKHIVPWDKLNLFNKRIITATLTVATTSKYDSSGDDLLACRDIMDKQIVDANGVKVVRVNDIKLEGYETDAVLLAVDVGIRGILRRLGFERRGENLMKLFRSSIPYNLISWNYIQPIQPKLSTIGLTVPRQMVEELHPADLADLITQVSAAEGAEFIQNLDVETAAEALSELEPEDQTAMISDMDNEHAADIVEEMPPDIAADLINALPEDKARELLHHMEDDEAEDIQELLSHESDSAGGLMTNEYIHYPPDMTVSDMLDKFKTDAPEMESVFYVYIIDNEERLLGVVSLKEVLLADRQTTLGNIMETNIKTVRPEADEMDVAVMISKYALVSLPVVDCDTCMLGIVTVDDVLDRILPRGAKRRRRSV